MLKPRRMARSRMREGVGLAGEAVEAGGASARRRVRAVLIGVCGVPRRQRTGCALIRTHSIRVPDLCGNISGGRRPVCASQSGGECAVRVRAGEHVVFDRRWGSGPLSVDTLTALIEEDGGVTGTSVEFGDDVGDGHAICVEPWTVTNPVSCVGRLISVRRVAFDAQVGAPRT